MENTVHIYYPVRELPEKYTRTDNKIKFCGSMRYDNEFWYLKNTWLNEGTKIRKGRRISTLNPHRKRPNVPFDDDKIISLLLAAGADLHAKDKVSDIIVFCCCLFCYFCFFTSVDSS